MSIINCKIHIFVVVYIKMYVAYSRHKLYAKVA